MKLGLVGLMCVLVGAAFLAVSASAREQAGPDIFTVHALVSDDTTATPAPAADASLVNGWGLSASGRSPR
jgi:hypothetical protein